MDRMGSLLALLGIGFFFGAATQITFSDESKTGQPPRPGENVVVLKGERRVTVEKTQASLKDILEVLSAQTKSRFDVDVSLRNDKARYTVLVKGVLLSHFLEATEQVLGGRWERRGGSYHLRPKTPEEIMTDTQRYEEFIQQVEEYIAGTDPANRPSNKEWAELLPQGGREIAGLLNVMRRDPLNVPVFAPEHSSLLQLSRSEKGALVIGYVAQHPGGGTSFHSRDLIKLPAFSTRGNIRGRSQ